MADKRLIDNENSTTVDKFYGNKDGKDVQIPLADAAAVFAGINGHGIKSISMGTPSDFNAKAGIGSYYYWGEPCSNTPDGESLAYGFRVVLFSDNYVFEFFYSITKLSLYYRAGSWTSAWKQISTL